MTTLADLVKEVAEMRRQQRAFFAAEHGSPERKRAYIASKACEKKVDAMVEAIEADAKERQASLFGK